MSIAPETKGDQPKATSPPKNEQTQAQPLVKVEVQQPQVQPQPQPVVEKPPAYLEKNDDLTPIKGAKKVEKPVEKPVEPAGEEPTEEEGEQEESETPEKPEKPKESPKASNLSLILEDLRSQAGKFADTIKDLPEDKQLTILYSYVKELNKNATLPEAKGKITSPAAVSKPKTICEMNESNSFLNQLMKKTGIGQSILNFLEGKNPAE